MVNLAQQERHSLSKLLLEVGPDAPTLCEGWDTRDLVAHLVVRESRPDAAVGIVVPPMAKWTDKVQAKTALKPYDELVAKVDNGPPKFSVFALPGVEAAANTMEYFVHHEDVRRAQPDWQPRDLSEEQRVALWRALWGAKRMLLRSSPVPVHLEPTDVPNVDAVDLPEDGVIIRGPVAEITMHLYGRDQHEELEYEGEPAAVAAYLNSKRGV
jgi:uncharacterized protein (TIGR03085 family)